MVEESKTSYQRQPTSGASRLKGGTNVSQDVLRNSALRLEPKRGKYEVEPTNDALAVVSSDPSALCAPTLTLEPIPEVSFEEVTFEFQEYSLSFRQNLTNVCCKTTFIEDIQSSSHLRSLLNIHIPLSGIALHVHTFTNLGAEVEVPTIKFTFPTPVEAQCTAFISSPKLTLIPCDLQLSSESSKNGKFTHTTRVHDVSASLLDAIVILKYTFMSGGIRRSLATIVCDFECIQGPCGIVLSKLASRSELTNTIGVQTSIPTMSFRIRKNICHERIMRSKPNLSLSIPPAQYPSLAKAALTVSLKTPPSSTGLHTPQDQRIKTPTAPPPIKTEVNPYVLKNFAGTPTEPFTPSFEPTYTATCVLNRLTMGAIAAGSPAATQDERNSLASPMISRSPMHRQSSSYFKF